MPRSLPVFILLVAVSSAPGANDLRPNTLTPKEIAEGWILLFDGDTPFGWKTEGQARAADGMLTLGGDRPTTARFSTELGGCEFSLEFMHLEGRKAAELRVNPAPAVELGPASDQQRWLRREAKADPGLGSGRVALVFEVPAGTRVAIRNFKLKPLGLASIFNGKDLAGWKEFPGRKSKFTVTHEGWLNIKDGPGDLQTDGQWSDFVLQLDCISHGQHLNSGVFFRCRPGEYQQGYEAQIRNQFTPEPTQEYTLDEFDPETGKKTGATKVKLQAVDFGTGAIYRRQPARRPAAKDGEWLTMTLVAHGRHLATWVNGIQVTDWTDNRPRSDNARNGCRLEKGPISLQGHDPTTDLSFRNFRVVDLPGPPVGK